MKGIKFLNNPKSFISDSAFVAHLSGIHSEDELFKQLSDKLEMPDYFGHNWNAVNDCLRDFHWMEKQEIILVHDDYPKLTEHELLIYIEVLFECAQSWKEGEKHSFEVVFPERVKDLVERIICNLPRD